MDGLDAAYGLALQIQRVIKMDDREMQADFEYYSALYVDQGYGKEEAEDKARKLVEMINDEALGLL